MNYCFCETDQREPNQLRQRLLSWSGHVRSWLDDADMPVHVVRYEDLLHEPEATFGAAVRFAGLSFDEERLRQAIAHSRFEQLQEQEAREGFRERSRGRQFFRRGRAGAWRDELTPAQAEQIVADHGEAMRRLHYPETAE